MNAPDPDLDPEDCEGLYECTECGTKTAQGRRCTTCGGEVECDA